MRIRFLFTLFLSMPALFCGAQNLVVNPGFEESRLKNTFCPIDHGDDTTSWLSVSGAPCGDYFRPSKDPAWPDSALWSGGKIAPYTGRSLGGFCAIYILMDSGTQAYTWNEYMGGRLSSPLQSGKKYVLKFHLALGPGCCAGISELGVYFTDRIRTNGLVNGYGHDHLEFSTTPQIKIRNLDFDNYSGQWKEISVTYTAKGGEKYFEIGNFSKNGKTVFVKPVNKTAGKIPFVYYYVDGFDLRLKTDQPEELELSPVFSSEQITTGNVYSSPLISFPADSSTLNRANLAPLYYIIQVMHEDTSLKLTVQWLDVSTTTNTSLSYSRTKALVSFITLHDISSSRISEDVKIPVNTNKAGALFIFSK